VVREKRDFPLWPSREKEGAGSKSARRWGGMPMQGGRGKLFHHEVSSETVRRLPCKSNAEESVGGAGQRPLRDIQLPRNWAVRKGGAGQARRKCKTFRLMILRA